MQLCLPARLSANMSIHSYFWQITCLSLFYYSYYYFHITQHLLFKANQLQSHLVCKQNCHMATKKAFDERPTVCVCMCWCVCVIILIQLDYSLYAVSTVWTMNGM